MPHNSGIEVKLRISFHCSHGAVHTNSRTKQIFPKAFASHNSMWWTIPFTYPNKSCMAVIFRRGRSLINSSNSTTCAAVIFCTRKDPFTKFICFIMLPLLLRTLYTIRRSDGGVKNQLKSVANVDLLKTFLDVFVADYQCGKLLCSTNKQVGLTYLCNVLCPQIKTVCCPTNKKYLQMFCFKNSKCQQILWHFVNYAPQYTP